LQRDLTDSTTQRNIGVAMGHQMVALKNIQRGLSEVDAAPEVMARDLENNVEVLAEAIQTVIRAEIVAGRSAISDPYDVVKKLTRGKRVTEESLAEFVDSLDISDDAKALLRTLTPATYTGLADPLVDYLRD
jgi:adenylosuccinate lyase